MTPEYIFIDRYRVARFSDLIEKKWLNQMGLRGWELWNWYIRPNKKRVYRFRKQIKSQTAMISEEKLQAIRDEAKKKYPLYDGQTYQEMRDATIGNKAYIAGRKDEAEKNESNAVGFCEWIADEYSDVNVTVDMPPKWEHFKTREKFTTAELYSLYINSK